MSSPRRLSTTTTGFSGFNTGIGGSAGLSGFDNYHDSNMVHWRTSQTSSHSQQQNGVAQGQEQHQNLDAHNAHAAHGQFYGQQQQQQHQRAQSSVSKFPPILPPIPRVASTLDSSTSEARQRSAVGASAGGQEPGQGHDYRQNYQTTAMHEAEEGHRLSFDRAGYPQSAQSSQSAQSHSAQPHATQPHSAQSHAAQSHNAKSHSAHSHPIQSPPAPSSAFGASLSPVLSSPSPSSDATHASQAHAQPPPRLSRRSVTSPDGTFLRASPHDSASPSSPSSATLANSVSSTTLGVPYSSTMAREKPRSGNMPLPATGSINGVPQHHSNQASHANHSANSKKAEKRPEMPPPSKSKTRLNLLNPVNLLMRRRSHQAVETVSERSSTKSLIVPPMDLPDGYDPRIKGNKVHDFSAPRPQRHLSYSDAIGSPSRYDLDGFSLQPIQQSPPDLSTAGSDEWAHQKRRSSQHTPVFVENFDSPNDDRRSSAVHAETLANSDFVARNSWQNSHSQPVALPPFGRRSQQLDEQQGLAALSPAQYSSNPASVSSRSEISLLEHVHGLGFTMPDQSPISPNSASVVDSRPSSHDFHIGESTSSPVMQQSSSPVVHQSASPDLYQPSSPPIPQSSSPSIQHSTSPARRQSLSPAFQQTSSPSFQQSASPPSRASPGSHESYHLPQDDASSRRSGALKHLPSTASRFSFQIASLDSMAEEKLLEEKHKQRNSAQQMQPVELSDEDEDESEFFDEDAMYDHDEMEGLDEPEVFGENNVFQHTHNRTSSSSALAAGAAGFHFSERAPSLHTTESSLPSPASYQASFPSTPARDTHAGTDPEHGVEQFARSPPFQLATADMPAKPSSPMSTNSFYFDDGIIDSHDFGEALADDDANVFDEDQFDDPSFLKKPQPEPQSESQQQDSVAGPSVSSPPRDKSTNTYNVNGYDFLMHNATQTGVGNFASDSPYSDESAEPEKKPVSVEQGAPIEAFRHDSHSQQFHAQLDTSSNSLSAYHNALAEAAQKAAADGRFTRQTSTATSNSTYSQNQAQASEEALQPQEEQPRQLHAHFETNPQHSSRPSYSGFDFGFQGIGRDPNSNNDGYTFNDSFSLPDMSSGEFGYHFPQHEDDDSYDFDDADLIAAANAEALSADDSGMYSQEFGFYARPRPGSADDEEDVNGGYFGQPGIEIQRQKSLREPNLTPITERSEFSTRNSFIQGPGSMQGMGRPWSPMSVPGSVQGLPSPALSATMLAHHRGMSPLARARIPEDDNMTLAEIRRGLHANAFAGSISSINSDYSRGISSPIAEYGAGGLPYSPNHPNPMAPAGYFAPIPRGATQSAVATGGVPMSWQRSTDSNHSYQSHSYSSSLGDIPSSPSPVAALATSPLATQAQAFSFFEGGDENAERTVSTSHTDTSTSNLATPKRPTSSHTSSDATRDSAPAMPSLPQTPSTARKAPPAPISTPGYSSAAKPKLGSPLKDTSYPPPPNYLPSPSFASFAASTSPTNTTAATTASVSANETGNSSPLVASPRSAGGYGHVGHKRTGSGADQINYVKERDQTGAKRWVLERRRTSEFGLAELIGREVIEGGI